MLITRTLISNAIIARKTAGVTTKVVITNRATSDATVVADLQAALGTNFREYHEQGLLHSKYMIIDQSSTASDPLVWTGSHNWSDAANVSNDENSIVIHDAAISNLFFQDLKYRFDKAIPLNDVPVLDLGPDQSVKAGDTVTLDAGTFNTYVWSTGEMTQIIKVDSSGVGVGVKKIFCRVTTLSPVGTQSDTVRITFRKNDGIAEQNSLVSKFNVSPNPTTGIFSINFTAKRTAHVLAEVLTMDGRVIWHSDLTTVSGSNSFRVGNLGVSPGLYMVRLKTDAGDLGRKLIVY